MDIISILVVYTEENFIIVKIVWDGINVVSILSGNIKAVGQAY